MHVDFYFDPTCPWCWVTSRWLKDVRQHRDFTLSWRTFSLAIKNQDEDVEETWRAPSEHAAVALAACEAVRAELGEDAVGDLYTELGLRIHHDGVRMPDLADAMRTVGIDTGFAEAGAEKKWRAAVEDSMSHAIDIVGYDVGVPIIIFDDEHGYFGPVMSSAPEGAEAVDLFDRMSTMARMPHLYELKRGRTARPSFEPRV